ncbi:methyltransferase domain-containing protein [Nonomuraea sp. NPDC050404]|uniref:class I SAM-dependent methyltransferase n=1 Tax=Nonomuraea sp. NPDC050404 TaxID=3155783 RepID=UPI0033DAD65A
MASGSERRTSTPMGWVSKAVADSVRKVDDRTASVYDRPTGADDCDVWIGLNRRLIDRHGAPGRELVDLGCGTGKAALRLASSGFRVTGMDLLPEMTRVASAKPGAEEERDRKRLVVARKSAAAPAR